MEAYPQIVTKGRICRAMDSLPPPPPSSPSDPSSPQNSGRSSESSYSPPTIGNVTEAEQQPGSGYDHEEPAVTEEVTSSPSTPTELDAASPDTATPPTVVSTPLSSSSDVEEPLAAAPFSDIEARAATVLEDFRVALSGKLVECVIHDTSNAVNRVLTDAAAAHHRELHALCSSNESLTEQLESCRAHAQTMLTELKMAVLQELQDTLLVDLSSKTEVAVKDSGRCADASADGATGLVQLDELAAAYLQSQRSLDLLRREREESHQHAAELHRLVLELTNETMQLRQRVQLLESTTVPVTTHRAMVQAKEEAEHYCEVLRLQISKMTEEVEVMEALREQEALQHAASAGSGTAARSPTPATQPEVLQHPPEREGHSSDSGEHPMMALAGHGGPLWSKALKELEDQAIVAANQGELMARLVDVEAQLSLLKKEKSDHAAYSIQLKTENDTLLADLQSMTFRNGVLSQQVASLLVKVEHAKWELKHFQQHLSAGDESRASAWPALHSASSAILVPSTTSSVPCLSALGRALGSATLPIDSTQRSETPSLDLSFLASPCELEEGVQQRLNIYAASHVPIPSSITSGLRRRMAPLRRLGCRALAVDLPSVPRLPACDQLSGYALGRPSSYTTFDPSTGRVTKQVSAAELSLCAQGRTDVHSSDGSDESSILQSASGAEAVPQLLSILDTIDKDESLDRFSVNSVTELVRRNQELLDQLFKATQNAAPEGEEDEEAEQRKDSHHGGSVVCHLAAAAQRRATTSPAASRKRQRESSPVDTHDGDKDGTYQLHGTAGATRSPSMGLVNSGASADGEDTNETSSSLSHTHPSPDLLSLTAEARDSIEHVVESIVRRHETRISSADADVSHVLIRLLASWRQKDAAVVADDSTAAPPSTESLLRDVLMICIDQSTEFAQLAASASAQQEGLQQNLQRVWKDITNTLSSAVRQTHEVHHPSNSSAGPSPHGSGKTDVQRVLSGRGGASEPSWSTGAEEAPATLRPTSAEEELALIEAVRVLLATASQKDDTTLQIYQAAKDRLASHHKKHEERMERLLLKLKRQKRLLKAMRHCNGASRVVASPPIRPISSPDNVVMTSQTPPAQLQEEGFPLPHQVFHHHPQASASAESSQRQPPVSPTAQQHSSPRQGRDGDETLHNSSSSSSTSSISDCDLDGDSGDEAIELEVLRDIQMQLALEQANYKAAQEELSVEKCKHVELYERMWLLETMRDDAVRAVQAAEEKMATMMSRDDFESVVADLDTAKATLSDRDAQLQAAHMEQNKLLTQIDLMQEQINSHQQRFDMKHSNLVAQMKQREQELVAEEGRSRHLQQLVEQLRKERDAVMENLAQARASLQESGAAMRCMERTIEELKTEVLARHDVQELLCQLYPNDTVLHANAQLVQRLGAAKDQLSSELGQLTLQIRELQEEVRQKELAVRQSVQERQAAEVRSQELQAALASASSASLGSAEPVGNADDEDRLRTIDIDTASVTTLRLHVRLLTIRLNAQAKDVEVLREAEAAWRKRETNLRERLDLLSRDPISETARKYGLAACRNFELQVAELDERNQRLQQRLDTVVAEREDLEKVIEAHAEAERGAEAARDDAAKELASVKLTLATTTATSEEQQRTIISQESQYHDEKAKNVSLAEEVQKLEAQLSDAQEQQGATSHRLQLCESQREQFHSDNTKLITQIRDLEKALMQSDAEKKAAREALAQGLSAASRQRRGSAGYRGQSTTFTQNLNISSPSH